MPLNIPSIAGTVRNAVLPKNKQQDIAAKIQRFKEDLSSSKVFDAASVLTSVLAPNTITRLPWAMTCDSWIKASEAGYPQYIMMKPNPKDIDWDIPFRKSAMKTAAGMVTFSWRDLTRGGTVFDEPILKMTMQSGSLIPVMTSEGEARDRLAAIGERVLDVNIPNPLEEAIRAKLVQNAFVASDGMKMFWSFLKLYNAPQIDEDTGEPNYIRLVINTVLFPRLVLKGQFIPDQNLAWKESADDPNQIEWTVSLAINSMVPNLGVASFAEMMDNWKLHGGSSGMKVPENEEILRQTFEQQKAEDVAVYAKQQGADEATIRALRAKMDAEAKTAADAIAAPQKQEEAKIKKAAEDIRANAAEELKQIEKDLREQRGKVSTPADVTRIVTKNLKSNADLKGLTDTEKADKLFSGSEIKKLMK